MNGRYTEYFYTPLANENVAVQMCTNCTSARKLCEDIAVRVVHRLRPIEDFGTQPTHALPECCHRFDVRRSLRLAYQSFLMRCGTFRCSTPW